ncbi:MAG TPA: glycoside hydrolase, partial [Capsulimonadaceae bacterium]|nr:glycoside hydrolase [Capsulimonadaceae bacterium]
RAEIARDPSADDLYIQPAWDSSRGQFGYTRKLTYIFFDKGSYVAQAKWYRQYAKKTGLFKSLAQKRRENPNVDRLIGAVNVWNWDIDKLQLCRQMKSLGMDHVLCSNCAGDWSNKVAGDQITEINKLGFLTSRYDIYQDVYPPDAPSWLNHEGWPQDLVWLPSGDWMKGWADIEHPAGGKEVVYQGGVLCSSQVLDMAKKDIPADLATHPYTCRFLDTTTASPWRECYNPAHPLTRSQDRANKMALLNYVSRDEKLVLGSETGIDPSVPYVDYYEGMMSLAPYRLPDSGYDMLGYRKPTPEFLKFQVGSYYRVPLWELVYHDCTVDYWYWGDSSNKAPEVWDQRDLLNILYGTPPMFVFDKRMWEAEQARFVKSYKDVCPLVRRLGYDEMLSHEFLTPDHTVQRTRWRSGVEITVNFGDMPYHLAGGKVIAPKKWLVRGLK